MDDFEKSINASDLIDWIMCAIPDWCVGDVREIVDRIEEMPSAQPEIIRCGECKHSFLHDNGEKISRICGLTRMCGTTPDDWFCADAERREE